jgi:esterase/lipase superfamily enzyme
MNVEYYKWYSDHLNQDMELKIYGHAGRPILVFPCQGGRFYEFEDFGMVDVCRWFIDEGKFQFYAVDSVDFQSWANSGAHPSDRAKRHEHYDQYITYEFAPFFRQHSRADKAITYGASMGAYHAANFFFRHPDIFDGVIALSGIYRLEMFIGEYMDESVYLNTPLAYLPNLKDPAYLEQYQKSDIIICTGQGAWEEPMLTDTRTLDKILDEKKLPHWVDIWGSDVNHDWPWWRKMLPYFLGSLLSKKKEQS